MKRVGVVFPGQGSQYVGMGRDLFDRFDYVRALFESATGVLGFDLGRLCLEGPEEELRRTANTQPALLLVSFSAWTVLKRETGLAPRFFAGHSLGEYTALAASRFFSFEDALRLTRKRGLLMEEACPAGKGGMAALLGPNRERVEEVCRRVSKGDYVVGPANLNSPDQLVLSGDMGALKEAVEALAGEGYKKAVFLNVSGPFHSPLMTGAALRMKDELAAVAVSPMDAPVVSNVDAAPNGEAGRVVDLLYRQMFSPVLWEDCVRTMAADVDLFVEVGPGKVLTNLTKRITPGIACHHVETMAEVEALRGVLQ